MRCADSDGSGNSGGSELGYTLDNNSCDNNHMGGPHPVGSPVLFADGSVMVYKYGYENSGFSNDATWQLLWCYNRTIVIEAGY